MVIPRKKRTSLFRQRVEKEWSEYYLKFVLKYADKLDWGWISENPNIIMDIMETYPDELWNWMGGLSHNPNITMELIEKYPDKHWVWEWISCNPNITMDIVEKYPDKLWNWNWISSNKFLKEKKLFTEKRMRKYLAAYRIQQYWDKALTNPSCTIGRNKINRN